MKHTKALSAIAIAAALALSACGSSNDAAKPGETKGPDAAPVTAPSSAPVVKSTPTPAPDSVKKSPRGNLMMEGGDIGTISAGSVGKVTTKFTVNAIQPVACNQEYSHAAENGNIIAVDMVVETTPELAQSTYPKYTLSGYDFKYIADNGTTFNGNLSTIATYSCIPDSEVFPSAGMGPAEKITAKVLLDVPAPHGILVLKSGISGGFEYKF